METRKEILFRYNPKASVLAMKKGKAGEACDIGTWISEDFNSIFKIITEEMHSIIKTKYAKNPFTSYPAFYNSKYRKSKDGSSI